MSEVYHSENGITSSVGTPVVMERGKVQKVNYEKTVLNRECSSQIIFYENGNILCRVWKNEEIESAKD